MVSLNILRHKSHSIFLVNCFILVFFLKNKMDMCMCVYIYNSQHSNLVKKRRFLWINFSWNVHIRKSGSLDIQAIPNAFSSVALKSQNKYLNYQHASYYFVSLLVGRWLVTCAFRRKSMGSLYNVQSAYIEYSLAYLKPFQYLFLKLKT